MNVALGVAPVRVAVGVGGTTTVNSASPLVAVVVTPLNEAEIVATPTPTASVAPLLVVVSFGHCTTAGLLLT